MSQRCDIERCIEIWFIQFVFYIAYATMWVSMWFSVWKPDDYIQIFILNSAEMLVHRFSKYLKPWYVFDRLPFDESESHIRLPHDYTFSW